MRKLAELVGQELEWTQPSLFEKEFVLRAGETVAATMGFRSTFGSFATGKSEDGCWTFKRVGFWTTRVTIRTCKPEAEIGTFHKSMWSGGGGLELPDGRQFRATTNLWQSKLEFLDESDAPLMRVKSRGVVHLAGAVEIEPRAAKLRELPWLVLLSWYLAVMMNEDAGAAAGGAAAGG